MILSLFSVTVLLWCLMVPCDGMGRLVVTLKSYRNPTHRMSNGKCCDHLFISFGRCTPCDAYFKLHVTHTCSRNTGQSCSMGRRDTKVVGRRDDHRFSIRKEFGFDSVLGTITVGLEIWDKDRISRDDYVDGVHASVPSVLPGPYHNPFRRALTLTGTRVTVELDVELYCDKNHYGAACNVKCISRDDDSSGHYTCDRHGRKICKSNWFGSSCTRKCVPRDDPRSGHFSCDEEGNRRCLRNWQGPSCKSCVKNWYGPRCSTHCAPQASDRLGHYKCRSDGTKQCLPTWFGSDCRKQCIPHDDDSGHYSCAQDGSKMCLHGWSGEKCTVFCLPQEDDELGHYACDSHGNKVCYDGFDGFSENCSLTCLPSKNKTTDDGRYKCTDSGVMVCNPWWYGPNCDEYCTDSNDDVNGHYTCDPRDGKKVCLEGWVGSDCRFSLSWQS